MKLKLLLLSTLFTLTCLISHAQPPNDTFAGAIPIVIPIQGAASPQFTLPFTTDGTTDSGLDNVGCSNAGNDQFFTWTATELALTFTSLNPGSPGVVVYDATGTQISCAGTFVTNNLQSGWAIGDNLVIQIYDFQGSTADVAFDLFTIPCPTPTGLSESVAATSADVSWTNISTSSDAILEYGPDGFTAGAGTIINITGGLTTANITGLTPETVYDYILTQDCTTAGNGTSVVATGTFTTTASCPLPTAIASSSVTSTSLDLNWTNNSTSTVSSIEYGVDGFTLGSGTVLAGGANSAIISGLMPATDYDFYITQDCSVAGNGLSVVAGPLSVETLCAVFTPDYLETFDAFLPICWEEATDGDLTTGPTGFGSGDWGVEEFAHASTSGGGAVNINLFNANTSDWVVSPLFDLSAGGYEVNLKVALTNFNNSGPDVMGSDDQVVLAYTQDGTTWVALQTWTAANQPATAGETFNADISSVTGASVQFGIYATEGTVDDAEDYDFHFDDFQIRTIPTCLDPNNLQFVSSTQTTADITWDSNNANTPGNFEYLLDTASSFPTGPDATATASGTLTGVTGTTVPVAQSGQITGLVPNTGYDVYVREICSSSDTGPWSLALAFRTACAPINDFNENFDGVSTPDLPACWSFFATDLATGTDPFVRTSTAADNSPANGVQLSNGSADGTTITADLLLISPEVANLSAGTHRVKFFADITVTSSTVEVGTMTDPNDPTTFTVLGTFAPTTTHTEYVQNFDTYTGTDRYIAFKHVFATTFDNLYLDDIVWEAIPPCQSPSDLALLSSTDTSIDLTWTNNDGAAASSILYGPVGFDPATAGTTVIGGPDTASITGLVAETAYDFYVTQDCTATGDGLSLQVGPLSVTTPCAAITAPYFVDFENFTAAINGFDSDQCWDDVSTTAFDWAIDNAGGTASTNTGPDAAFSGTTFMFVEASNGANGDTASVNSPAVDLSALTAPSVSFYYHMYGALITSLEVGVSIDNGATFTNVLSIVGQQQTAGSDDWSQAVIDLAAYAGQTVILNFSSTKGSTGLTFDADVSLDDINFDELPVCNDVTAVTIDSVTGDSVTVSWTENSLPPATAWEVIAVPAGDPAPAVGTSNATANPFTIPGLSSSTSYDIYVRADCATTFVAPISATTEVACGDIVYDTGGVAGNYSDNESYTVTYLPDATGNLVTLDFTVVDLETCCDTLEVFDGLDVTATTFTNDLESPARFRATNTDGAITIRFTSDSSVNAQGWEASYTCAPVPTCLEPSALTVANITATTADLSWTSGGSGETAWDVELLVAGTAATGTPTDLGVTNPFLATTLTSGTDYEYYVRAACGPGDVSIWSGPFTFTTTAACGDTVYDTGGATGNYSDNESYTVTYLPDNMANVVTLDFISVDLEDCCDTLTIYDGLDNTAPILEADLENPAIFTALNTDGAITIEFTSDGSVNDAGWEANFTCTPRPSCVNVSGITVDSTTSDSVTVSWIENNIPPGVAWEVVAVLAGDPIPVAGTSNATTNPFTIPSLTGNTTYDIYVRTDCLMTFAGPITATTDCDIVTMFPASTDFTNNVPNACWSEAGSGEIADGPLTVGASDWRANRSYTNAAGTVVPSNAINLWQNVDREWLISETYDLSSLTTKVLSVEVAVTNYSFTGNTTATDVMGSDDQVDLLVTDDSGLTWTSLQTWNVANQPAVDGERVFIDLAAYSGVVQFAFLGSDGTVDDTEDYDFHVGLFVVDATAGSEDVILENNISLYPNPVSGDTLTINLGNDVVENTSIIIYNTLGQQVMTRTYDNLSNGTILIDNLASLNSGVYLVHISNGASTAVKRFIKQ